MKSDEVSIGAGSTPASLSFGGRAAGHTTVKWSIAKWRFVASDIYWQPAPEDGDCTNGRQNVTTQP